MIKAILFDFDGVLTTDKTGSQSILNALSDLTGIPVQILKMPTIHSIKGFCTAR